VSTLEILRERLATLEPTRMEIVDDSASHAGHAGARSGGGHFLLTIVSPRFAGLGTMARHRLVYAAAGDLMNGPIHALSITARSPEEL
jgi:BolA protein